VIDGTHAILYAKDARRARAFFRDVLKFPWVDDGDGWLIFALPPAEMGVHPCEAKEAGKQRVFFTCSDVKRTVAELRRRRVRVTQPIRDTGWGLLTAFVVPGLGETWMYQPKHATPPHPASGRRSAKRRRVAAR
jgi:catechol 2,3-dioxygenase-like lactoylglutathione lyase family enzyme